MAIHRTFRKPDSPAQVEAQDALRAALTAVRNHQIKTVALQSGVSDDTLYAHVTQRKYPLRVPAGRLRAIAQSLQNQISTLQEAHDRLLAAAAGLELEAEREPADGQTAASTAA